MYRSMILSGLVLLMAACSDEPSPATPMVPSFTAASVNEQAAIATARAATARFQRFEIARDAGHTFLFMNSCMVDGSSAARGGMGYHYVNTELLDDKLDVSQPEAVMYEPEANGRLRLVGVEYVIPADAWTSKEPPRLFGRALTLNAFNLWALHLWIWKENPSGIFADWNPRVSCDNAAATMAH